MADPLEKLLGGGGDASPEDDAAKDVLAAVKAGDAKALSLALTRHYEACSGGADEETDEDEDEEDDEEV